MNKETILKYLTEFNAWVKGQEIYVMFSNGGHRLIDSLEDFNKDVKYIVLRDSYFPYRTALAEGKTIQFNENNQYHTEKWVDTSNTNPSIIFTTSPKYYRIKPEEPEFKVGDYVRYIHTNSPKPLRIININCERYYFENAEIILRVDEIEKWQPQVGEWCTLPNGYNGFTVSKFISKEFHNDVKITLAIFENGETSDIAYVEPFIGTLPTHLKDNK